MKRWFGMQIAGLAGIMLLGSLAGWAQVTAIKGKVTGPNGQPLAGAVVKFHRTDISGTYQVKTNKKGKYGHYGLPFGEYNITVYDPKTGKALYTWNKVHTQYGQVLHVNFNLQKLAHQPVNTTKMDTKELALYKKALAKRLKAQMENAKVGQLNQMLVENHQLAVAGQWQQAAQLMQKAISLDQTHALLYATLGNDYSGGKLWTQAIPAYQKAIAMKPVTTATPLPEKKAVASYFSGLATAQANAGQIPAAEANFKKAIELDPTQAGLAFSNEAVIFYNSNQSDAALKYAVKAIAADPSNSNAWFIKAMCLMNMASVDPKTGKVVPAPGTIAAFKKYIALDPNGPNVGEAQASIQALTGKVQTSIQQH